MPFIKELTSHLSRFAAGLRARRSFADLLQVQVAQDITADAAAEQGRAGVMAYTSEQSDLEAARLIRESIADGRVTADEIPALRTALRHVTRSAASDHRISEHLAR